MSNYVRISDQSPIHSTGLKRLSESFNTKAAAAVSLLLIANAVRTNSDNILSDSLNGISGALLGIFIFHAVSFVLEKIGNNYCYDTEPSEKKPITDLTYLNVLGLSSLGVSAFALADVYENAKKGTVSDWHFSLLTTTIACHLANAHRVFKVLKGDWSLETPPPPAPKKINTTVPSSWWGKAQNLIPIKVPAPH